MYIFSGTGTYGHPEVLDFMEKYRMRGYATMEDIEKIHFSVGSLAHMLKDYGRETGLNLEYSAPYGTCEYIGRDRKTGMKRFDTRFLWNVAKLSIKRGAIPFSHGDIVHARPPAKGKYKLNKGDYGFEVISSDFLVLDFGKRAKVDKVIMVSSENGVYETWPPEEGELPIKRIYCDEKVKLKVRKVAKKKKTEVDDVSGGMKKKLELSQWAAERYKLKVQIINGLEEESLYKALIGNEEIGTLILPEKRPKNSQ